MNWGKNFTFWALGVVMAISLSGYAAYKIANGDIILGNGGSPDTHQLISNQPGTSDPFIQFNDATSKWEFTNDGSLIKSMGSGSGSGDGGINVLANPGAEDLLASWTASTPAQFTVVNTVPDVLAGDNSFEFDGAAQNDEVASDAVQIGDGLIGKACEARIYYKGDGTDLIFEVLDADDNVLGDVELGNHETSNFESAFFLCPNDEDITSDADADDLRARVRVNAAVDPAPIVFDRVHLGSLIGLVEVETPDVFSALVDGGTGDVSQHDSGIVSNCSQPSTGIYECPLSGLDAAPNCVGVTSGGSSNVVGTITTNTEYSVNVRNASGSLINASFYMVCQKAGADATRSVQVYKSIPKVAENTNFFSAKLDSSNANILSENVSWLSSCTRTATGVYDCDTIETLSTNWVCNVTGEQTGVYGQVNNVTTNSFDILMRDNAGSLQDIDPHITCSKQESDYVTPTVQPILVNQLETSVDDGQRIEATLLDWDGVTFQVRSDFTDRDDWITSVQRDNTGDYTIFYDSDTFGGKEPACMCTASSSDARSCTKSAASSSTKAVFIVEDSSSNKIDSDIEVMCMGGR